MSSGADRRGVLVGLTLAGLGACRRAQEDAPQVAPRPAGPAVLDLSDLERLHGGRIGLSAVSQTAVAWRGDERFNFCSTFKLFLAACMLERIQRNQETLERTAPITRADILPNSPITEPAVGKMLSIRALLEAAVELSDNGATNILIREMGGLETLRTWYRTAMGDVVTSLDRMEPELNRRDGDKDTTTPNQTTANLSWVIDTYQPFALLSVYQPLWEWLIDSPTGPNRIHGGVPSGWTVAHKTGTGPKGQTNDIGYAYPPGMEPIRIAVYYDAPETLSIERREAVIAETTRRALTALGHPPVTDTSAAA